MSDSNTGALSGSDPQNTRKTSEGVMKPEKKKNVGHLPSELLQFVKNESYSLLIKGKPGTGKTTFALTLLDNLNDDSNYFYISTRLSLKQLAFYFPWIEKFFSNDETTSGYRFEDARLDEPESLFERITNQLMDVKSPVILIDTWDTIASFMDRESRLNNERVLQIWRERAGAKLIFLSETFDLGILDSIVDGVVTLENRFLHGSNSRKLTINKLRGIPIQCNTYTYSLFEGVFRSADSVSDLNLFNKIDNLTPSFIQVVQEQKSDLQNHNSGKTTLYSKKDLEGNKLINILLDKSLSQELFLSVLTRPLRDWLQIPTNCIMINNFDNTFKTKCEKILGIYFSSDLIHSKIINQQINFSEPFGIKKNDHFEEHDIKFAGQKKVSPQIGNSNLSSLEDKFEEFHRFYDNKNDVRILNLLSSDKIHALLNSEQLNNLLHENFDINLVVYQNTSFDEFNDFLKNNPCWEFKIDGKNIIVNKWDGVTANYETIVDSENFFINWFLVQ